MSTAKRRAAILGLKWEDVSLHLPAHEITDFGNDGGNKKKGRTPITGNARIINALKVARDASTSGYVIEIKGARVKWVKTAMAVTCRHASVGKISPHLPKHTAIIWMVQSNMTYDRIAKATKTTKK